MDELGREKEQLNLQIAEVSILARIKQEEGDAELSPQGGNGERKRENWLEWGESGTVERKREIQGGERCILEMAAEHFFVF